MPRIANPYRPGFNQAPASLAGRDAVLAAVREALDVAALDARTPRPLVLAGGRGVGKTVLLGETAAIAADTLSWLTVPVEVRPGRPFTPQLVERLHTARHLYDQAPAGGKLMVSGAKVRATVLGVGGELDIVRREPGPGPAVPLEAALAEACEAAQRRGAGLVVTLDELQLAGRHELADFAATLQQHVGDDWPLVVVLAGLPNIRDSHRGVTYLERSEWHVLGLLDRAASVEALTVPAAAAGRPMSAPAAAALAEASGGYPYAIQVMGHHAWRASHGAARIDVSHVPGAIEAAEQDLAAGLYASRWEDASPREREYLAALAWLLADEEVVGGGAVARRLGKDTRKVSYLRDRLLRKGTVFAQGGGLRFAVPGMAGWIRSHVGR